MPNKKAPAHDRELRGLGTRSPRQMGAHAPETVSNNFSYGAIN